MTLKKIADLSGTSVSTVSRVLSNHPRISEATKARVMKVVKKYGFELNPAARALAGGRTGMVGVLAANIGSGFFAEVIHGIDDITRWQQGHILCSFASDLDDYYSMLKNLSARGRVDGMILVAPPAEIYSRPCPVSIPMVICASMPPDKSRWNKCDSVVFDNEQAMKELVKHLVGQKCQTIWHAAGPALNFDAIERKRAFGAALKTLKGVKSRVIDVPYGVDDVKAKVRKALAGTAGLPDAIIAWNDSTAIAILEVLKELPEKASSRVIVTGWDDEPIDNIIGLTSVRMPMRDMGENAARRLYERLSAEPRKEALHERLKLDLVVR